MPSVTTYQARLRRHRRVRGKVRGTAERPRLLVFRSNRGIFAQLIDDDAGKDRRQRVLGGMGIAIMSTSRGVVTSRTAEKEGIGGEVLCYVW